MKKNKLYLILAFVIITAACCSYFFYTSSLTLLDIEEYFWQNKWALAGAFLALYSIRIFIFLPSTVIIIALGVISKDVLFTFLVSFVGIAIWLTQTYLLGSLLSSSLEWSTKINRVREYSEKIKKRWFSYILIGCFFPVFPTDIICYSAWFIKYNFTKFLIAWMLWELVLILAYSYLWKSAEEYLLPLSIIGIIIMIMYVWFYFYKKKKN